ncbi:hypothetical protein [Paenibacillus spongiae]|uniref:Fur-regulated basic protein FbpA n=1 Tax=Paenibacillus spongiae TaxID=2909671 RepID=A0ABY5S9S8_9BACL|nr:hypothetical protein [Paenibacillus spongiae]UVI30697.1 hypothetical protein L1F29_02110 [Paenibacillus spongiae]
MTNIEMMQRRNEILKRNIGSLILKDNKHGLNGQENYFYNSLIKELHMSESQLNNIRNRS